MKEANAQSVYERLRVAELLDETFTRLMGGEKPKAVVRWLDSQGIATSQSSLYQMVRKHGFAWRYEQAREQAAAEALPADMDVAAAQAIRRRIVALSMEASTLKEVETLARIQGDTERLKLEARRVAATERNTLLKVHAAQQAAAAEVDEILSEADRLEELRRIRAEAMERQASDAERIDSIRLKLYGPAAVDLAAAAANDET